MSSASIMKSNSLNGSDTAATPPISLRLSDESSGVADSCCRTKPEGLMLETLTTSLNMKVITPVLALKVKPVSSGSTVSCPTKPAILAFDSITGRRRVPATSVNASEPSTM